VWEVSLSWESPFDEPPPQPDVVVQDGDELRALLWARAAGDPYMYNLRAVREWPPDVSDCLHLSLGGGEWGRVGRSWRIGPTRWYRTSHPTGPGNPKAVHFEDGREGVGADPGKLLPVAEVIEAAVYFVTEGGLSPRIEWIGWECDA
jgi:hypothetical protein